MLVCIECHRSHVYSVLFRGFLCCIAAVLLLWLLVIVIALENTGMTESAIGTGRNQCKAMALLLQPTRSCAQQPAAGRAKRVTKTERSTFCVHLVHVDRADFLPIKFFIGELLRIHCFQVGKNLSSKGLVNLKDSNVLFKVEIVSGKDLLRAVGRTKQKLLKRVARLERPVANVSPRPVSQLLCFAFAHQERGSRSVCQETRIGCRVSSVWFNKGRLKFRDRFNRRVALDSILVSAAFVRDDLILVEAVLVRLCRQCVRPDSKLILLLTRNPKLCRQSVTAHSHHLASCVVGNLEIDDEHEQKVMVREEANLRGKSPQKNLLQASLHRNDSF